ncbi:MAG: phosphoribosylglycinamide formyltransferase [Bacteroidetes bacterium MedPE-SWsnd-G2]|nr:MAG: phosphoribosylglycinamide formyltransferase [Bacteroidetes bacterium MedPE-SWsnd-G2]
MKRIVVFASGSGSNAENLISYFNQTSSAKVVMVLTNNPKAKVIDRCNRLKIPCLSFNRSSFYDQNTIKSLLISEQPDLIVLAGFLWKFPESLLEVFNNKVINVHPALLPKFGGKGMYGSHVHEAVVANKETESGITIHYVNENYDEGAIIFQGKCDVLPTDSPSDVASKIHELEMEHFPKVVNKLLSNG